MSRNSDKANTVLFRYQEQKAEESGYIDYNSTQRPRNIGKVLNLKDSENWRKQVLKEINQKITKIHDDKLSNYQIRDLNDDINKLMKEKYSWEYHIRELGGTDYIRHGQGQIGFQSGVLIRGYRYFGRAKELPGVKELIAKQDAKKFEKNQDLQINKTQREKFLELEERINLDYFGYYDEINVGESDEKMIWNQVNEIIGENIEDEDEEQDQIKDELLKYERSISRKFEKKLQKEPIINDKDIIIIEDNEILTLQQVENHLVMKKRQQLVEKYSI
ncbi:Pre-mRNA-splicing factor [Wickerhamomyces ciferrii]|uniref:Pre-mRNA-splicing factor ISY1 n=1 Tax=Wickerhamomyces ciferrii (strain ATCC 14091 / BCRC 22168 / CBS 111 / JCM 3599 / NBRC 0793 / NRRL Y-1031 F-60-10) TaxID=1206466 RepID=K0KXZ1_WICCF|nr:Pre-mRNA-splicing factor [Wickerhamomyces ciferrii]CCH45953.1 Pre-mRNA-splicing factor [Wickerhamomyces ciferrii]